MRILMVLLLILGLFFLITGIITWVNSVNSNEALGVLVGLSMGISFTIVGGSILFLDLLILIFYLYRKRKKTA